MGAGSKPLQRKDAVVSAYNQVDESKYTKIRCAIIMAILEAVKAIGGKAPFIA